MRPILALLLSTAILGSLSLYLRTSNRSASRSTAVEAPETVPSVTLRLLLSFDARPDPFSVAAESPPSILVEHAGKTLYRCDDVVRAGPPVEIPCNDVFGPGPNAIYVRCVPQDTTETANHAVRVQAVHDGQVVAERTLWSHGADPVEGVVGFEMKHLKTNPGNPTGPRGKNPSPESDQTPSKDGRSITPQAARDRRSNDARRLR